MMSSSSSKTAPGRRGGDGLASHLEQSDRDLGAEDISCRGQSFKSKNIQIIMSLGRLKRFKLRRNKTSS